MWAQKGGDLPNDCERKRVNARLQRGFLRFGHPDSKGFPMIGHETAANKENRLGHLAASA